MNLKDKLALLDEYLEQFSDEEFAERLESHGRVGPTAIELIKSFNRTPYNITTSPLGDDMERHFTILNSHLVSNTSFNAALYVPDERSYKIIPTLITDDTDFYTTAVNGINFNDEDYCCAA